jgi:hypothetical protein
MLALTIDVDWAPDLIVDEVIAVLESYRVPATIFCTNFARDASGKSSSLSARVHEGHEIALHPNFQNGATYDAEWDDLLRLYPGAKGWRSHNGMTGWPITRGGAARGLRYEVYPAVFQNYVVPCQVNRALKGHYVFTTAFMDSHMLHEPGFTWTVENLPFRELYSDESRIVILGFHPTILFYDMGSIAEYETRRPAYHDVDEKSSFRHRKPAGAMKLFLELLDTVPCRDFTTMSSFGALAGFW